MTQALANVDYSIFPELEAEWEIRRVLNGLVKSWPCENTASGHRRPRASVAFVPLNPEDTCDLT